MLGGIAWTLGYDTIYAHQDKEDDVADRRQILGAGAGRRTRPYLFIFYAAAAALWAARGIGRGLGLVLARLGLGRGADWSGRRARFRSTTAAIAWPSSSPTARWAGCCWRALPPRMSSSDYESLHSRQHGGGVAALMPRDQALPRHRGHALVAGDRSGAGESAIAAALLGLRLAGRPGAGALHPRPSRSGGWQNRARYRRRMRAGGDRRGARRGARDMPPSPMLSPAGRSK